MRAKGFYVSCLLAAALGFGFAPAPAFADGSTQQQIQDKLNQVLKQGATQAANGAVAGMAGQINALADSEKTGEPMHDAAIDVAKAGVDLISQLAQLLLDKVLNGTATPQDLQQLQNLPGTKDDINNGNFGPGSGPNGGTGGPNGGAGGPNGGTGGPNGTNGGPNGTNGGPNGTNGGPNGTNGNGPGTNGTFGGPGSGPGGAGGPGSAPGGISSIPNGSDPNGGGANGIGGPGSIGPGGVADPSGTGAIGDPSNPYGGGSGGGGGGGYGGGGGGYGGGGDGGGYGGGGSVGGAVAGPGVGVSGGGGSGGGAGGGAGGGGAGGGAGSAQTQRVRGRIVILPRHSTKPLGNGLDPNLDGRVAASFKPADKDKLQKLVSKVKKGDDLSESLVRLEGTILAWKQAAKLGIKDTPAAKGDDDELGEGPAIKDKDGKVDLSQVDAWLVADWTGSSPRRYQLRFKDAKSDLVPGSTVVVRGSTSPLANVPKEIKDELSGDVSTLDAQDVVSANDAPEDTTAPTPPTTTGAGTGGSKDAPKVNGNVKPGSKPAGKPTKPNEKPKGNSDDNEFSDD